MDLSEALRRRRMVRSFLSDPVDEEALARVLDAGRRAPSAGNTWATHFLVLVTDEERSDYWDCTLESRKRDKFTWPGLLRAPVLVVVWVDPSEYARRYALEDKRRSRGPDTWSVPFWFVDAGMAVENMLLSAVAEGLGASFFGVFGAGERLRDRFGVPPSFEAVGTVAIGKPAPDDRPSRSQLRGRPPIEKIAHWGRW